MTTATDARIWTVNRLRNEPALRIAIDARLKMAIEQGDMRRHKFTDADDAALYIGEDEAPIAFLTLHELDKPLTWWLDTVWTAPDHRRQGHAQRLVQRAVTIIARQQGELRCGVVEGNAASRALFAKCGFVTHSITLIRPFEPARYDV